MYSVYVKTNLWMIRAKAICSSLCWFGPRYMQNQESRGLQYRNDQIDKHILKKQNVKTCQNDLGFCTDSWIFEFRISWPSPFLDVFATSQSLHLGPAAVQVPTWRQDVHWVSTRKVRKSQKSPLENHSKINRISTEFYRIKRMTEWPKSNSHHHATASAITSLAWRSHGKINAKSICIDLLSDSIDSQATFTAHEKQNFIEVDCCPSCFENVTSCGSKCFNPDSLRYVLLQVTPKR